LSLYETYVYPLLIICCSEYLLLLPSMLDQFLQSKREGVYQRPNGANTGRIGPSGTSAALLCHSFPTYPICGVMPSWCRRRNWLTRNPTLLNQQESPTWLLLQLSCGGGPAGSMWYLAMRASIFSTSGGSGGGRVSSLAGSPISSKKCSTPVGIVI